jgi:acetyl esterase/lipase
MKSTLLFVALLFAACLSIAQSHCDGIRYIQPVFTAIDSSINISYGENTTTTGQPRNLRLDVYFPAQEFFFRRPVVILAHGGSFISGNRKQLRLLCHTLAYHGFVAATIDYRLYDDFNQSVDSIVLYDVVTKATGDMKAAIRFMKSTAASGNEWGIDTNLIIIGGVSAGAITALQSAYLDVDDYATGSNIDSVVQANGGIRGNSNSLYQHTDNVIGVLNFSGALKESDWIDEGEPTVFSVHDEFDQVVPYGQDFTDELGTPVEVSGSKAIHEEAQLKNIRSQLMTIAGSDGHVSYFINGPQTSDYINVVDSAMRFLEYTICDRISGVNNRTSSNQSVIVYPNPASSELHIASKSKVLETVLIDMQGRRLWQWEGNPSGAALPKYPAGAYKVKILMEDGSRFVTSLIIE